jgi:putative multiple sugar transport system permease protein
MREYGMFIALFAIVVFFTISTPNNVFISPRNISNLINQNGYIAVLAVGMTLVIVIRHIDLSVGSLAGFLGAVVTIMMVEQNISMFLAIPAVLVIGAIIGMFNGLLIAKVGMPAFVVTLAGMMGFRGGLFQITQRTGTILIGIEEFNNIGNGFIPDIAVSENFHFLTLTIGAIGIILFILFQFRARWAKQRYKFDVPSMPIFIGKLLFIMAAIGYLSMVLAQHNGLSWTVIIVLVVVIIYHFITSKTVLGRHIYAVGSNPEASKLTGISVSKITVFVFGSMGMLAALSGVLFTARLQAATINAGEFFELDAIAGAFVGGVSSAGGVGKVTGSIIGALVMASLTNGMQLMGRGTSEQHIVRGIVLLIAVAFDVISRRRSR